MLSNATDNNKPVRQPKFKKKWSKKKKIIVISSIVAGAFLIAGGLVWWFVFAQVQPEQASEPEPEPVHYYSQLTGIETTEANTKRPVTAVMIENSPESRPQSGLHDAGIVFEAIAEGGITRFVALYQEAQPDLLGPVRSVRPYYIEWAAGFDAAVAHVGGSDDALSMIRSGSYGLDLDQFFNDDAYWRSSDRYAPHNMYTSSANLDALEVAKGKTTSEFTGFERQDGARIIPIGPTEENPAPVNPTFANQISLPVSTGTFTVSYTYDAESNTYNRFQGNEAHTDAAFGQISPDVVIAIMVDFSATGDSKAHNDITTTGSGTAYVFQNGIVEQGKWQKDGVHSQIHFVKTDGSEIKLNRGQTWITALGNDKYVTWQ
jgi:hypothetical protein